MSTCCSVRTEAITAAKYTRGRGPCTIAYLEEFGSKSEAMSREWHLKKLTHREREMLVHSRAGERKQEIM